MLMASTNTTSSYPHILPHLYLHLLLQEEGAEQGGGRESLSGVQGRLDRLEELERAAAGRSCHQLQQAGLTLSGWYWLDPDGRGGAPPVRLWCDLRAGVTRVQHSLEGEQVVAACRRVTLSS